MWASSQVTGRAVEVTADGEDREALLLRSRCTHMMAGMPTRLTRDLERVGSA